MDVRKSNLIFLVTLTVLLISITFINSLKSNALSNDSRLRTFTEAPLAYGDVSHKAKDSIIKKDSTSISRIIPAASIAFIVIFTSKLALRSIGW